jgi:hypothetical protein
MKEQKSQLCDALAMKAIAHFELGTTDSQKFADCMKTLSQWVDLGTTDRYTTLAMIRDEQARHFGLVLQRIEKLLGNQKESSPKDVIRPLSKSELYAKRIQIWETMGCTSLVNLDKRARVVNGPKAFSLF